MQNENFSFGCCSLFVYAFVFNLLLLFITLSFSSRHSLLGLSHSCALYTLTVSHNLINYEFISESRCFFFFFKHQIHYLIPFRFRFIRSLSVLCDFFHAKCAYVDPISNRLPIGSENTLFFLLLFDRGKKTKLVFSNLRKIMRELKNK